METARVNPFQARPADAARLLSEASGRVITAETLERDVEAGAPVNGDGTLNLVHYAAWLLMKMGRG